MEEGPLGRPFVTRAAVLRISAGGEGQTGSFSTSKCGTSRDQAFPFCWVELVISACRSFKLYVVTSTTGRLTIMCVFVNGLTSSFALLKLPVLHWQFTSSFSHSMRGLVWLLHVFCRRRTLNCVQWIWSWSRLKQSYRILTPRNPRMKHLLLRFLATD